MKKFKLIPSAIALMLLTGLASCSKDDDHPKPAPQVYVAGTEYIGNHNVVKYWMNGEEISLTDGTNYATANSIFVVE